MTMLGILFILSSVVPFYLGFDKLLNYSNNYNSSLDASTSYLTAVESVNAYVGGDAYNYIINANYFTGYMVLGLALILIGGIILICNQIKQSKNNNHNHYTPEGTRIIEGRSIQE
ncbi:hypothetical protein [Tissierella sp.]|uniref:hypothetical protein n=1 Tax=Tissierella sp. TaxID=41274 RepID=UPI002866FCB8|nr:hypothetical protein [Tissierella sp.]MDR7856063.1 hypothetical protein [Tissierella sp.]